MQIEARNNITVTADEDGRQVTQQISAGLVRLPVRPERRVVQGLIPRGFGRSSTEIRGADHDS